MATKALQDDRTDPRHWTFVLSFLVLVIIGALKAYRRASEQLGISSADQRGEATDVEPNFLDMAFYSLGSKRLVFRHFAQIGLMKYPALLTVVLVEAAWLWWQEVRFSTSPLSSFVDVALILGAVVWVIASWQVGWYWTRRFADRIWL